MSRTYRPYQGRRAGPILFWLGAAVLAASALAYLLAPFSVRKFAAFPALGGAFLVLYGLTYRAPQAGRALRSVLLALPALEGIIIAGARDDIRDEPDVVVVLGAQVHPWGPSVLLCDRLDTALDYLERRPDLPVVVTGGQGPDEHATEASVMRDYLTANGLDEDRIWLEEEAHNTSQNLDFTRELLADKGLDPDTAHILVVSNGFHLARVRMLAGRHGLEISTLAAPETHAAARFQSYLREAPALVKSFLLDR